MRHMGWLIEQLGLDDDKAGRKQLDGALRFALDMPQSAHCPEIWAAIKELDEDDWVEMMPDLQRALGE
jgi:hypothetical protein